MFWTCANIPPSHNYDCMNPSFNSMSIFSEISGRLNSFSAILAYCTREYIDELSIFYCSYCIYHMCFLNLSILFPFFDQIDSWFIWLETTKSNKHISKSATATHHVANCYHHLPMAEPWGIMQPCDPSSAFFGFMGVTSAFLGEWLIF